MLTIIERAYRGSVEQQYAHSLWLVRSLARMSDTTSVVLRGSAVMYAVVPSDGSEVDVVPLPDAGVQERFWTVLQQMMGEGIDVFVLRPDVVALGLAAEVLIAGVQLAEWSDIAGLIAAERQNWYL